MDRPPFPHLLDSTMLASFDGCEQRFQYSFVRKIATLGISPDLHAGGAFSRALEAARRAYFQDGRTEQEALIYGMRAMMTFWGDFDPPSYSNKTLANTVSAFEDYLRQYPLSTDEWQPLMVGGKPCVEFTFSIPTEVLHPETNDPILYGGRCDMVAQHRSLGIIAGVDEKTMGKTPSEQWQKSLGMRGQFLGYAKGMKDHGYDVSQFIIRGIGILKTKTTHLQAIEILSDAHIEKWWQNANKRIRRMKKAWENWDWELSFGDACSSYNGCEFLQLCLTQNPEDYMDLYQPREWNPLEKDPTWPKDGPQYEKVTIAGLGRVR